MSSTKRLYWNDAALLEFDAAVIRVTELGGRPALVLDQTAFYPESGGQLADRGTLRWADGQAALSDCQEVDGELVHVLELPTGASPPTPGARVCVSIDRARRRDHMAQHTGQHLLSRALLDVAGAQTISSRLGEDVCTIDTPEAKLSDQALLAVQERVMEVVLEDRPIHVRWPTPEELPKLALRREPKVSQDVRVIEVEGFDLSPCGGTHCSSTGQVGLVKVVGVERYKGGLRLTFLCGLRAFRDYVTKDQLVSALSRDFSSGLQELPAAIARLRSDVATQAKASTGVLVRLAALVAQQVVGGAARVGDVTWGQAWFDGEPIEYLRAVASEICRSPQAVALIFGRCPEGVRVVLERGAGVVGFEAGATMKRLAAATGGRGGGRPDRAEGLLPPGPALSAAVESERRALGGT